MRQSSKPLDWPCLLLGHGGRRQVCQLVLHCLRHVRIWSHLFRIDQHPASRQLIARVITRHEGFDNGFHRLLIELGNRQSTAFSRSFPETRRASGVRTRRPNSWVMCVWLEAARNDIITLAIGQSLPVLIASLASKTRTQSDSCTRSGAMYGTVKPP